MLIVCTYIYEIIPINKSDISNNANLNQRDTPSQWSQIASEIVDKLLSGTNMSTTINFDNLKLIFQEQ